MSQYEIKLIVILVSTGQLDCSSNIHSFRMRHAVCIEGELSSASCSPAKLTELLLICFCNVDFVTQMFKLLMSAPASVRRLWIIKSTIFFE